MRPRQLDVLIWTLTYGGLAAAGLGGAVQRTADALGWTLVAAGAVAAVVGIVLIGVRSRMKDTTGDTP
jgi:hypothetical protein